jgi:uncharacterized protein involved in exopolysaccharide biosynthesis
MNDGEVQTYWRVIRKRLWVIGLLMIVTLGVMLAVFFLSKPLFKATTLFQVTSPLPAEVSLFSEFKTSSNRDELLYTRSNFLTVLQSEYVLNQVIDELDLNMDVDSLLKRMVVEPEKGSDFIKLSITAEDPQLAAAIVNTQMDKGSQFFGELSAKSITANKEFIEQQLQDIKEQLNEAKADLIQFQIENRVGSLEGLLSAQQTLVTEMELKRDRALVDEEGEAKIAAVDEVITVREGELQDLILLSAQYDALRDRVNKLQETYSTLLDKETEAVLKENEILNARFIQVIPAEEPAHPLPQVNLKILLLGALVSLALGIMLAFILEYHERVALESDADGGTLLRDAALDPGKI